jgi:hypothetical protein
MLAFRECDFLHDLRVAADGVPAPRSSATARISEDVRP